MTGPLPPYAQIDDFLAADERGGLLDWVLANEARFASATITDARTGRSQRVDPAVRKALILRDLGPLERQVRRRLLDALGPIIARTGSGGPVPRTLELELAAHGDGAHFAPHIDLPVGPDRKPLGGRAGSNEDRLISAVYYFHAEPKSFAGGELRLFRFGADPAGGDPADHVDLQPLDNRLVAFPSWATHEVRPVRCASARFRDYRFALNCWYCAPLASSAATGQ